MNSKRLLCFLLGAALILQTPATAYAAETLTYEQYRGGSGYSSTIKEQDYAVIEICGNWWRTVYWTVGPEIKK